MVKNDRPKTVVKPRDTLLEDYIGKIVICHLGGRTVRGVLKRVARYEVELDVGGRLVVVFKHALTHVSILSSPKIYGGGRR